MQLQRATKHEGSKRKPKQKVHRLKAFGKTNKVAKRRKLKRRRNANR